MTRNLLCPCHIWPRLRLHLPPRCHCPRTLILLGSRSLRSVVSDPRQPRMYIVVRKTFSSGFHCKMSKIAKQYDILSKDHLVDRAWIELGCSGFMSLFEITRFDHLYPDPVTRRGWYNRFFVSLILRRHSHSVISISAFAYNGHDSPRQIPTATNHTFFASNSQ